MASWSSPCFRSDIPEWHQRYAWMKALILFPNTRAQPGYVPMQVTVLSGVFKPKGLHMSGASGCFLSVYGVWSQGKIPLSLLPILFDGLAAAQFRDVAGA